MEIEKKVEKLEKEVTKLRKVVKEICRLGWEDEETRARKLIQLEKEI